MKRVINWGILGAGRIADKFAFALKYVENARLYAVGSRDASKAQYFAQKHNIPVAYNSYKDLVSDDNIDIVYIATPHVFHAENTIMCLEAGKAVLCEKPFAMNSHQVEMMISKAKEKNLFLMEALWTRFLPTIRYIENFISSGNVGEVIQIHSDFGFKAIYDPESRLFNKKLGGGCLLDIGIYPVFISLLLLGYPDEIVSSAIIGKTEVDESMSIIFKYNKGAISLLSSTFKANTTCETIICGTEGMIKIHKMWHAPSYLTIIDSKGNNYDVKFNYKGNGYEYEAQEVTNCLLNNLKESPSLSLSFSQKLITLLDNIRKHWGLEYDL